MRALTGLPELTAWSPDARRIAIATRDDLSVCDRDSGNLLWHLDIKALNRVSKLRFSRDGTRLLALPKGAGHVAIAWEAESGQEIYRAVNRDVHYVLFSPDDSWLAVAEVNHSIGIFNATDGTPVLEFSALRPDHGPDGRAAVSPLGREG